MRGDAGLVRIVLGILLVGVPACTAVFGVDFDNAHPRVADDAAASSIGETNAPDA